MATFDALAPTYDDDFSHTQIGRYLRERVHQRLLTHFSNGDSVLELGCGTGEDAQFLAEQRIHITATDASPAMLTISAEKLANYPHAATQQLDLNYLQPKLLHTLYDGVFANFGVLNCVQDLEQFANWLSERVAVGGIVAFGVMSPYCVWEMLWHGLHLNFGVATRRLRGSTFQPNNSPAIPIMYPRINQLKRIFAPHFEMIHLMPLGLFLPPSDVYGVIEKRPKLLNRLQALDSRFDNAAWSAVFADHYWIEFRRIS